MAVFRPEIRHKLQKIQQFKYSIFKKNKDKGKKFQKTEPTVPLSELITV